MFGGGKVTKECWSQGPDTLLWFETFILSRKINTELQEGCGALTNLRVALISLKQLTLGLKESCFLFSLMR